jgi:hypothetical protein
MLTSVFQEYSTAPAAADDGFFGGHQFFCEGDQDMASNSKKTKLIRARKARPNRKNLKADMKRLQENTKILRVLADQKEG